MAKSKKPLLPCPDPERYVLVTTREGQHWRKKRRPGLNAALQPHADRVKLTGPAAKRIRLALASYLHNLETGRLQNRLATLLKRSAAATEGFSYTAFRQMEWQPRLPLERLLQVQYKIVRKGSELIINLPIGKGTIAPQSPLVTDYYFEMALLHGNPFEEDDLAVDGAVSPLYTIGHNGTATCELGLPLPPAGRPWMTILKVSCLEGNELAVHPRHYGIDVVGVG